MQAELSLMPRAPVAADGIHVAGSAGLAVLGAEASDSAAESVPKPAKRMKKIKFLQPEPGADNACE